MFKYLVILLSLFSVNSARVIYQAENKPLSEPQIIGSNPKTWSPVTVVIPYDSDLDCSTCKILVAAIETEACSKCPESETDKCTQFVTKFGDPEKLCQLVRICPKTSWLKNVFG